MQMIQKWLAQKANQSVLFWLLGGLLFRGFVAFWLYPGFDEAYYYLYSIHLDWSYFDHPVLVALLTGFGPWLTGDVSQFTIRLGSLILYTGSLVLLYLTSAKLFSEKAARITLAIASIIPIFQISFGILTLPDVPLMFFWTASLYCGAQEFFPQATHSQQYSGSEAEEYQPSTSYQPSYRLAILGVLVGLACLGKYHGFVLGLGLVGFCLTSSRYRPALLSPWAWLGLGLFIVTIFPILFWNIQHDWVSFRFQLNRGVPQRDFSLLKVGIVFLSGVAYLFPTFGLPLWWVTWRSVKSQIRQFFSKESLPDQVQRWIQSPDLSRGEKEKFSLFQAPGFIRGVNPKSKTRPQDKVPWRQNPKSNDQGDFQQKQLLILWVSLPLTLGFTIMGGYQQILPTWPMPGFWSLTLLLGQQSLSWQQQSRRWVQRWLKGSGLFIGTCLLLALLHVTTGTLQSGSRYAVMGGFWRPQDDPSTELIDIQQLRRGFAESPLLSKALHDSGFIFTNGYYLAGQIAMALTPLDSTPITCFAPDIRGFAFWSKPDQWLGKDALYITLDRFHKKKDLTERYRAYFSSLQEIGTVPIRRGGGIIEVIHVSQAKTLLKPYPRPYGI